MMKNRNCYACHHNGPSDDIIKKPYQSKSVLDIRMVPGHPHRAWIECYKNTYDEDAQVGMAEVGCSLFSLPPAAF